MQTIFPGVDIDTQTCRVQVRISRDHKAQTSIGGKRKPMQEVRHFPSPKSFALLRRLPPVDTNSPYALVWRSISTGDLPSPTNHSTIKVDSPSILGPGASSQAVRNRGDLDRRTGATIRSHKLTLPLQQHQYRSARLSTCRVVRVWRQVSNEMRHLDQEAYQSMITANDPSKSRYRLPVMRWESWPGMTDYLVGAPTTESLSATSTRRIEQFTCRCLPCRA